MQHAFQDAFGESMRAKLASRPDLLALLVPTFAPGCRRLTPGKGFLEALLEENVKVVSAPIKEITSTGVSTTPSSGDAAQLAEIDVLVCATGFHVSSPPPFPILGRSALPLTTRWSARPETYLSLAVDQFPNLLLMFGPNSAIGFGSLTKILEAECDYAVAVVKKLQKEDYASIEPKAERVRDFVEYVDGYFKGTVYEDACRSWYRRGGKVVGVWPGSTVHALEALRAPRWEDWVYESVERGNGLRWLGNGRSNTQAEGGGDASWYINPAEVEVPVEGRPEENERYKARPWSY